MAEKVGVIIARLQPIHNGHLELIRQALNENDSVLVLVGSADKLNKRNPIPINMRLEMANEAVVGLGTFEVREYVPATAFDDISDLTVSDGWSGPYTSNNYPFEGETYYYFTKTVTITEENASARRRRKPF